MHTYTHNTVYRNTQPGRERQHKQGQLTAGERSSYTSYTSYTPTQCWVHTPYTSYTRFVRTPTQCWVQTSYTRFVRTPTQCRVHTSSTSFTRFVRTPTQHLRNPANTQKCRKRLWTHRDSKVRDLQGQHVGGQCRKRILIS